METTYLALCRWYYEKNGVNEENLDSNFESNIFITIPDWIENQLDLNNWFKKIQEEIKEIGTKYGIERINNFDSTCEIGRYVILNLMKVKDGCSNFKRTLLSNLSSIERGLSRIERATNRIR